ncbi:MAG: molybdopterin cofactor-binding domain-containing protein [Planctomycetota bacterium]|nr:molybdopterin cofactor-binding domain-containing protein [Planctomycetota bacterium]
MTTVHNLSRRSVLKGLVSGSGLLLGVQLGSSVFEAGFEEAAGADAGSLADLKVGLFLSIERSGTVTILASRSEMGTGIRTVLPLVAADELDAHRDRIEIEQAIGDRRLGSQNTDGSKSIRQLYQPMREAGATARAMLENAAAKTWKVPANECRAQGHAIVHSPSGRKLDFGALVETAAGMAVPKTAELTFKSPVQWRYVGKDNPIVDLHDLTTGAGKFGLDITPEGCKFAVIARSPVLGGGVESVDARQAKAVRGVIDVVELEEGEAPFGYLALGGVAVIADNTWAALRGRDALQIKWADSTDNQDYESDAYSKKLQLSVSKPGRVVRNTGDVDEVFGASKQVIEASYNLPHLAHAPMEPPCAVAHFSNGRVEAWAPTQNPQASQTAIAQALRLTPAKVTVHVTLLGGGFGRKSKPDYVVEAALLSKRVGAPVKVTWTREDDLRHDYYHSVAAVSCKAAVDGSGRPVAWLARAAFPSLTSTFRNGVKGPGDAELGMGFVDLPYAIPNMRFEACDARNHVRIGWLRSVANVYHAFASCSFTDELADAVERDPLEYTLDLIGKSRKVALPGVKYPNYGDPLARHPIDTGRLAEVLKLCAAQAGWGKSMPKGRGLGLAVHRSFVSYVAVVADVEVSKSGDLTIHRVDIAIDCGLVIDPDRVRAQMEGSVVFGVSLSRYGKITAKDGRIVQGNFDDYPVVRMPDSPKDIQVHLVKSEATPGGVGEPGVPPVAPAICAAIFRACGKRVRSLPLSEHDLSWS